MHALIRKVTPTSDNNQQLKKNPKIISRSRSHLEAVRVNVHHLVEIIHALIREVTSTGDFLIINNLKKPKMISRPKNHLKDVRVNVHHLVEIMHALIRKLTSDNT